VRLDCERFRFDSNHRGRSGPASAAPAGAQADGWRTVVSKFAQEHFHNPAWGYSHSVRDYMLARELAATDHVTLDDDVLYAAAYLHDMAAFEPWGKTGVDHADQAAAIVDSVLKNTGSIGVARVFGLVDAHGGSPTGPEAITMLESNLAKVPARVLSPAGRARVPERREQLETFLRELRQQSDDFRTL
jgi:hypothetical protein